MGRMRIRYFGMLLVVGVSQLVQACSSKEGDSAQSGGAAGSSGGSSGGSSTSSGGGGATDSNGSLGTFQVTLNPAVDQAAPYTSVFGGIYAYPYPTDVIETSIASNSACNVYKFSRQACIETPCGSDVCVAPNVCKTQPSLVSVGDVTLDGVGTSQLKLTAINNNYQYPLDLPYPGISEGSPVTLNATGGTFAPFTVAAKGVASAAMKQTSYLITPGKDLTLEWTPGAAVGAKILITFNISKHGGSAGYMKCETTDSGSLTIPANLLQSLVDLGVAGYPELMFARRTSADATVSAGRIGLEVTALAKPPLSIYGYCSCFNNSDCGSCSDTTKTVCDSVKKLCHAP